MSSRQRMMEAQNNDEIAEGSFLFLDLSLKKMNINTFNGKYLCLLD